VFIERPSSRARSFNRRWRSSSIRAISWRTDT
jgi:hypothetical protein